MRRSKRIHRWLESFGAQGNLHGNFPVTRRSCCGSSPETVLRRLKPLPTIVSRPQPSADWCPRHDPDDHPYRLGSTPVNANHSRRTAECKRDPFRQHDLGCGTGRFKSARAALQGRARLRAARAVAPPRALLRGHRGERLRLARGRLVRLSARARVDEMPSPTTTAAKRSECPAGLPHCPTRRRARPPQSRAARRSGVLLD